MALPKILPSVLNCAVTPDCGVCIERRIPHSAGLCDVLCFGTLSVCIGLYMAVVTFGLSAAICLHG
jgi:hypothetical protein